MCTKMNSTQWMPFFTILDYNPNIVPNISDYVIPQFCTYQSSLHNPEGEKKFINAIPCSKVFENVTDDSLKAELVPLWEGTQWMCPNVTEITLNNNIDYDSMHPA